MAANPILGRGVTHSGAGVLPGLPILNVAGTSVGIRILAQGQGQQQNTPHSGAGGSVSVQRVAAVPTITCTPPPRVLVSLPHFLSFSLSLSTFCVLTVLFVFCVHDTDECCCSSCKAYNFC